MNIRLRKVSNRKETHDGITFYHLRRVANGQKYGLDVAFTDYDMQERALVAHRLLHARRHLRAASHGGSRYGQ